MGLGKTLTALALIATSVDAVARNMNTADVYSGLRTMTLVVTPKSSAHSHILFRRCLSSTNAAQPFLSGRTKFRCRAILLSISHLSDAHKATATLKIPASAFLFIMAPTDLSVTQYLRVTTLSSLPMKLSALNGSYESPSHFIPTIGCVLSLTKVIPTTFFCVTISLVKSDT